MLNRVQLLIFSENETAPLSDPLDYLYEANTSILKAGAFNSIANNFKLRKYTWWPFIHFS